MLELSGECCTLTTSIKIRLLCEKATNLPCSNGARELVYLLLKFVDEVRRARELVFALDGINLFCRRYMDCVTELKDPPLFMYKDCEKVINGMLHLWQDMEAIKEDMHLYTMLLFTLKVVFQSKKSSALKSDLKNLLEVFQISEMSRKDKIKEWMQAVKDEINELYRIPYVPYNYDRLILHNRKDIKRSEDIEMLVGGLRSLKNYKRNIINNLVIPSQSETTRYWLDELEILEAHGCIVISTYNLSSSQYLSSSEFFAIVRRANMRIERMIEYCNEQMLLSTAMQSCSKQMSVLGIQTIEGSIQGLNQTFHIYPPSIHKTC